jgi:glutamyl-tRNA reductase
MLYHVDDLRAQAEQNRLERQKSIDPALAIIERETAACSARLRHQHEAGLLLLQLGNHADQIRQRELATLFATRPDLTEADQDAIAHMAMRLQNQFLHHPRVAVRLAATESHHDHSQPHPVITFVRHIFGLGDRAQNSLKQS